MNAKTAPLPQRKPAPTATVNRRGTDQRAEQLRVLDAENPEYVHSYQTPQVFGKEEARYEQEMAVKNQEVVTDSEGRYRHHLGDPIVRTPRKLVEAERQEEARESRERVEAVVKPERSTVLRRPQQPIPIKTKEAT